MRGFILATLLAGAQGIGDLTSQGLVAAATAYGNQDQGTLVFFGPTQVTAPWDTGVCLTGTKQSPIDIVPGAATVPTVDPGTPLMAGHDVPRPFTPVATTYALTLHQSSVPVAPATFVPSQPIALIGGPFAAGRSYIFDFAEFHFGPTDTAGSEHTIDGASSPMEMYLVYHDTAGIDIVTGVVRDSVFTDVLDLAVITPDAARVAAISVHFEIQAADNPKLAALVAAVAPATAPTAAAAAAIAAGLEDTAYMTLTDLLPTNKESFYYYNGSLTAPADLAASTDTSCMETVSYMIYTDKVGISAAQLAKLRLLGTGIITPTVTGATATCGLNSRAVQTNANTVYNRKAPNNANAIGTLFASSVLSIGTFGALYNFLTAEENADLLTNNPLAKLFSDAEQRLFAEEAPAVQERNSGYQANHHHHPQNVQY